MNQEYREAFEEIYEIFNLMPKELLNKIPIKFYKMIEKERNTNYFPNIKEPIEEQRLKNETIVLLGLIYRDFLCSQEERKKLQEKDAREIQALEKTLEIKMREKYNPDDLFKNEDVKLEQPTEKIALTNYKESFFKRIKKIVFRLFHLK